MLPVVLLATWVIVQYALVAHARHGAQVAAQDAALQAVSTAANPELFARQQIAATVGSMTSNVNVTSTRTVNIVTVTVTAEVVRVIPIGTFTIAATASAPIEQFDPEAARP